jgi:hypothetical protein
LSDAGVWGIAEYTKPDMPIHYCVNGRTVCTKKGIQRLLRLPLTRWNPDNPRTCPKCKAIYDLMMIEKEGMTKAEV